MVHFTGNTQKFVLMVFLGLSLLTLPIISGCASTHRTTTTTTVTGNSEVSHETMPEDTTTTTRTETTTNSETTKPSSPGLISSTFHFIGAVIAFPFKLIGGAFEAIF